MASKADWARQRRDDAKREYLSGFLMKLDTVQTLADGHKLALDGCPPTDSPGRLAHTNLIFFLESIAEGRPTFPGRGSYAECAAYRTLAKRLHANHQIGAETLAYIEHLGLPPL